ncbi:hypothetical protein QF019_000335 [Pseudomonas frederiksbergensis]|uniref:hypothetical protein n=1 Tax=Pseudomonas frederiksbergensis TaxID=104087 RepID=UPI003D232B03
MRISPWRCRCGLEIVEPVLSQAPRRWAGTSTSKTYAAGSTDLSAGENFALALLVPLIKRSGVMMLKRI